METANANIMKILFIITILSLPAYLFAQDDSESTASTSSLSNHALGGSASMVSAPGISYEYIFGSNRIKLTGFAYMESSQYGGDNFTGVIGGELQQDLQKSRSTRLYGFIGGYYWYENNSNDYSVYSNDPNYLEMTANKEKRNEFSTGLGIGFEVQAWKHIFISLDISMLYRRTSWNNTIEYEDGTSTVVNNRKPDKYLGPGTGFSIYYRF
jgi:hypothetical protein